MEDKLNLKLTAMVGKAYLYNSQDVVINGFYIAKERVYISTDVKMIVINVHNIWDALKEFFELEYQPKPKSRELMVSTPEPVLSGLDSASIIDKLLKNIDKVEADKSYIDQANAINATVNTVLNVVKTELSYRKLSKAPKRLATD